MKEKVNFIGVTVMKLLTHIITGSTLL